ncbi:MAG TPA: class I SAM-dependent methyltransferase [Ramlibacter sp.]|nr:class I SAM-dependent methyltransferase [Ramlibacter sp.]
MEMKSHWEQVYRSKPVDSVSWYQPHALRSLELIRRVAPRLDVSILDVGGGASTLVDDLLDAGMTHVGVLDISAAALQVARRRLGPRADRVQWIEGDITSVELAPASVDVWHDRAVFHFLTEPGDRAAYVRQVRRAVRPGGHVIVAAFSPDGPPQCSGLPVVRYAPDALHAQFGSAFELVAHELEAHHTPSGAIQQFVYCLCVMH